VASIDGNVFGGCLKMTEYDFSTHTSIPTLVNVNAFNQISALCVINVPASLFDEWKIATNWNTYANYMVGV
jgi:hypothetical protein